MFARKKATPEQTSGEGDSDEDLSAECQAQLERQVRSHPALWRALAFPYYATVRDELERLEITQELGVDAGKETARRNVASNSKRALNEALGAMRPDGHTALSRVRWSAFKLFYSGSRIELTWTAIHRARAALYLLYGDEELDAQVDRLQELVGDLPEVNPLRGSLTMSLGHLRTPGKLSTELRAGLRQIYEQAIGVSESLQREARDLRNSLMVASLAIALVLLTLGFTHAANTSFMNLCAQVTKSGAPTPAQTPSGDTPIVRASTSIATTGGARAKGDSPTLDEGISSSRTGKSVANASASVTRSESAKAAKKENASDPEATVCPLGHHPSWLDIFALELAGMLGGLLSVVIPLATGERIKTPYRIFNQQLGLKMLSGAASGLAGVMLLEAGLVPGFSITSSAAILGYAVLFGFSQQIVTGFVDRRASTLAKETIAVKGV